MSNEDTNNPSLLTQYLADRDEPCPACGYNLRSLVGESCPECGQPLRLHLGMINPNMGWVFAGLIGLAMGVGFNALILTHVLVLAAIQGLTSPVPELLGVVLVGLLIEAGALTIWVARWREIGRSRFIVRVVLVATCYLLTAASYAGFSAILYSQ